MNCAAYLRWRGVLCGAQRVPGHDIHQTNLQLRCICWYSPPPPPERERNIILDAWLQVALNHKTSIWFGASHYPKSNTVLPMEAHRSIFVWIHIYPPSSLPCQFGSKFNIFGINHPKTECLPTGVLWSVAPSLVFVLIAYAVLGTWFTTTVFGRRLMALDFGLLKSEGDLRFDLVRVRENAGAVCPKALGYRFLALGEYDVT